MGNKSEDFNQLVLSTLSKTTKLPFVKVSREEFLKKEFKGSEYLDIILKNGPQSVFTPEALRKRATKIINDTTKKTALTSFVAGLPSNPITATLSGGADVVQYFGFSLNQHSNWLIYLEKMSYLQVSLMNCQKKQRLE